LTQYKSCNLTEDKYLFRWQLFPVVCFPVVIDNMYAKRLSIRAIPTLL